MQNRYNEHSDLLSYKMITQTAKDKQLNIG